MSGIAPLLFSSTGPQATPPATLQANLVAVAASISPGYTANLPGSLIDDISGTDVGALMTIDQARVDAINSVSPYAANPYILAQQGQQFGLAQGLPSNGSVYVVFTGTPGYVIPPGFTVSDGTNQYVVQDGGVIGTGGTSQSLFTVAVSSATFPIASNTVTTIVTSVPTPYTLTVTNPEAGTPAEAAETVESYRSRLLQAQQANFSGTPATLKTLLLAVPGVSPLLVSVRQVGGTWEVICGGGDAYQVAGAIYQGVEIGLLTGSTTTARNVTVSIYDAPDTYTVTFVNPPQQVVTLAIVWNTTLTDFTAQASVNQFMIQAGAAYINSIVVGQPINLLVLTEQIQTAIASVLAAINLTTLEFTVTINGTTVSPSAGTSIIVGDPESYFYCAPTGCTATQG